MKPLPLLILAAALAALAACVESGPGETNLPASDLPPVSDGGSAAVSSTPSSPPPAASQAPSRRDIPEQPGWTNPDVPLSAHQRDIEACYDYAWAQVERDLRIESDIQDTMDTMISGLGFSPENRQADLYGSRQRRYRLFESCMRSRGYEPT
jgi:hypothetical protein